MKVEVDAKAFAEKLAEIAVKLDAAADDVLHDAGDLLKSKVVFAISRGSPQGRFYKRGAVTHRASAPGDAPATDTGRLINSIYVDKMPGAVVVGSNLAYAAYLERGTIGRGGYVAPRPVWVPKTLETNRELPQMIEQRLAPALR